MTLAADPHDPQRIVVTGGRAYWTSSGTPPTKKDGALMTCPLDPDPSV